MRPPRMADYYRPEFRDALDRLVVAVGGIDGNVEGDGVLIPAEAYREILRARRNVEAEMEPRREVRSYELSRELTR